MKIILQQENISIITVERNDEFIESLTNYCSENKISAGYLTAIGACGKLTLAYYNLETKKYEDHEYTDDMEITGIIGNVALIDGKPFIHAHGTFGKRDMNLVGGHIRSMTVSATCEVRLEVFKGKIEREFDEVTGLKLMHCTL
jgi:hypothetical protein